MIIILVVVPYSKSNHDILYEPLVLKAPLTLEQVLDYPGDREVILKGKAQYSWPPYTN
jgi:hypothetical protein